MPSYTPPTQTPSSNAPGDTGPAFTAADFPEKASTPPQGVQADRPMATESPEQPAQTNLLAGKFKSPADLEKAYLELQSKLGQKPTEQQPQARPQPQAQPQQQPDQQTEQPQVRFELSPYEAEFVRDGQLSDASYDALDKMGFDRDTVDQYVAGRQAKQDRFVSDVTASVGGAEGYQALIQWAAANLNAPDIVAFNVAVQSGDVGLAKMAVEGLKARHEAAEGRQPNLLKGQPGSAGGYESVAQMKADMNDPRYLKGHKAFHAMVDRKLQATTAF
jgi:hypothetical protein